MTPPRSNFLVMRAVLSGQIMVRCWVDVAGWPDGPVGERGVGSDRRGVDPDGTEGAADGTEGAADGTEGAADGTEGAADGTEGLADGTEGLADGDGGIAASSARRTGVGIGRRSETAKGTGGGWDRGELGEACGGGNRATVGNSNGHGSRERYPSVIDVHLRDTDRRLPDQKIFNRPPTDSSLTHTQPGARCHS